MIDQTKFDNTYNNYTYKSPVEAPLADFKTNKAVIRRLFKTSRRSRRLEILHRDQSNNTSGPCISNVSLMDSDNRHLNCNLPVQKSFNSVLQVSYEEDNSIHLQEIPRFRQSEDPLT
jgi:hypothetical protein